MSYSTSTPQFFDIASGRSLWLKPNQTPWIVSSPSGPTISLEEPREGVFFRVFESETGWLLRPASDVPTLTVNQTPVTDSVALTHRSIVRIGEHVLLFLDHEDAAVATEYAATLWLAEQMAKAPAADINVLETATISADELRAWQQAIEPFPLPGSIDLPERPLLVGRDPQQVDVCLPDVLVSRIHAKLERRGSRLWVTDLRSQNGTYVSGKRISQPTEVTERTRIQIGSKTWVFRRGKLFALSSANHVELVGRELTRRVPDRKHPEKRKVILDRVSLVVRPREFVCILGPSGSGKSTLLAALSGRQPADEGSVFVNGDDLYQHFEALKQSLAVVPQRDVLHDVLPLSTALRYTARMRLPADLSEADIDARIDETLDTVNLIHRQYTPIRQLSGGQIRRASWANEAISNPSLIFVDEVTSGLDEQTDLEMMSLFRRLADEGRTLVCVTHSLSHVEAYCDLVVILTEGGKLAFYGPPAEARTYFGVKRLGEFYHELAKQPAADWQQRFLGSSTYETYVTRRLPSVSAPTPATIKTSLWPTRNWSTTTRQFSVLVRRYTEILLSDRRALALMFGQCLVIAVLLAWLFGDLSKLNVQREAELLMEISAPGLQWNDLLPDTQEEYLKEAELAKRTDRSSKLLFLLAISCIWMGCNGAAKEIVKERTIFKQERNAGLRIGSYYASKLVLLGLLGTLQASLLFGIVWSTTRLGGSTSEQWLLLVFSELVGVALGLAISALSRTEDVAVTIVPMVLIPQIILAGLIAPLVDSTKLFAEWLIPAYWAYQGLLTTLPAAVRERLLDDQYLNLNSSWSTGEVGSILTLYLVVLAALALVGIRR
jgi:ABC-type multidrug transport system ATPase subunit